MVHGGPALAFEALYYGDRLQVVNPSGDVGVVTLWTPVRVAAEWLARHGIALAPEDSRIAVIGTLYGDGLPQMVRNLLWNPQITTLLVFGQDLSDSAADLIGLLTLGAEPVFHFDQPRRRICGRERHLDPDFPLEPLVGQYRIVRLGKLSEPATEAGVRALFADLPARAAPTRGRIAAPLPAYIPVWFPSEPRAHTIVRRRPLDAFEEVVCRILRFGVPGIASTTKRRLELQNLKVVVGEPVEDADEHLRPYGFSLAEFTRYQLEILSGAVPETLAYTYGSRLRTYWRDGEGQAVDTLEVAAARLRTDATDRGAYISLWDSGRDLPKEGGVPCLVSLFFRVFQGRLTLTATFRTHNTMSAWLKNVYGLIAIQRLVAERAGGLPIGPITVFSHSISIDPESVDRLALARAIAGAKPDDLELDRATGKRELREDPCGYFTFTLDEAAGELVADLRAGGETLTRYRGRSAYEVERQIARDSAISDLGHALYVGRQLGLLEAQLRGRERG